jgi:shikimate kinase
VDPNRIFLVGYRGSGKSTVGWRLAAALDWEFADADLILEERAGRSVAAIFAEDGEAGFREREAANLRELAAWPRHVIATGGGAVLRPDNRELLRTSGWVVWLSGDPTTLWQRIERDPATQVRRPPLTEQSGPAEVEALVRAREPHYREVAHCEVATAGKSPDEIVSAILSAWTSCWTT